MIDEESLENKPVGCLEAAIILSPIWILLAIILSAAIKHFCFGGA